MVNKLWASISVDMRQIKIESKINNHTVPAWAWTVYYLSWFGILIIGGIVVIKTVGGGWSALTSRLDIFLLLFTLFDFVILNRWILRRQLKRERLLFLLISLFFIVNTFWHFAVTSFGSVGIYHFQIAANYLLILLPLPLLATARRAFAQYAAASKTSNHRPGAESKSSKENERRRRADFSRKYPRISAIPIIKVLIRWMHAEGWIYSIGIGLIFIFGFLLRIYKLGHLSPAGDEFRHLLAMKHFFTDGYFEYHFSSFVTFILIGIKKLTGTDSLFLLRLPFVLFGSASILLLYGIGRKVSKCTGLIAAYLFAFLPIAVGMSRYIRGYEIEMFIVVLAMFIFLTLRFRKRPILNFCIMSLVLILLNYLNYDSRFDAATYFFIIFSGMYTLIEFIQKHPIAKLRKAVMPILFTVGLFATFLAITNFTTYKAFQDIEPGYLYVINYVNTDATWFFTGLPWFVVALVLSASLLHRTRSGFSFALLFISTVIMLFCLFYFFAPRRFQVRYIYYIFPYVILLLSIGLDFIRGLFRQMWPQKSLKFWAMLCVLFMAVVFGPWKAVFYTVTADNGLNSRTNEIAYFNNDKLVRYINEHGIDVAQTLTTSPWVLSYYFNVPFLRTLEEKAQYINTPWDFELLDRGKIFSIAGYWDESDIQIIKQLIKTGKIKYLILHAIPKNEGVQFQPNYLPSILPEIELAGTIDADKTFGYYIYRVVLDLEPAHNALTAPTADKLIPE